MSGNNGPATETIADPSSQATPASAADEQAEQRPNPHDHAVVAVGASAGGLSAFRQFLTSMPADSGMSIVLLQHLDPIHKSLTAELLQPHTVMPVAEAQDRDALVPNRVYLLPPDRYMILDEGRLRLTHALQGQAVRLPIDVFLRSLAEQKREKAVAIILTGGGSDGSQGIRAVVSQGGLALVQDPNTAEHDGMPRSAIQTGVADQVLPISRMPEALLHYARHPYLRREAGGSDPSGDSGLPVIIELLRKRTGQDFARYKKGTLTRRILRRMSLRRLETMADYASVLRGDDAEAQSLLRDLLIGVTGFFREPAAWEFLDQHVLAPLVAAKPDESAIRLWVAGCSTGEEAYSLTMLVLDRLEAAQKQCRVEVFASDINRQALEFARTGVYAPCVVQDVAPARLARWFVQSADQQSYRVCPQLRASVVFAEQNLLGDAPFSKMDLITCRNLLIYLEPEVQAKALELFHFALREGGHLFLGNAETIGRQDDLFTPVSKPHQIYQRIGPIRSDRVTFPIQSARPRQESFPNQGPGIGSGTPPTPSAGGLTTWAQQLVLARHTRACVLINERHQILYLFGPTHRYLQQPVGPLTDDLLAWVPEELRPQLRLLLQQAQAESRAATADGVRLSVQPGTSLVHLTVEPVRPPGRSQTLFLVVIDSPSDSTQERGETVLSNEPLVGQLERELHATRENLQASIQELEGTNEGLKAANEEVTSMNEELRSVNEELETSKEELQSLNEELRTVNQQLQAKAQEADRISDDLRNVLASTDLATIFLDRDLRIRQFTPAMTKLLSLISSDQGRPLADFAGPFANVELHDQARQVLEQLTPTNDELQTPEGRWFLRRTLPYRTTDHRIDGVVITFTEITIEKQAEARLQALNDTLEQRVVERTEQLRSLVTQLTHSEEDERRKLATALHDGLQQLLVAARMRIGLLPSRVKDQRALAEILEVDSLLAQSIDESRSLTAELAPPVLYQVGLIAGLEWLVQWMRDKHHFEVHVEARKNQLQDTPEDLCVFIFQAVREMLFNSVKHAGVKEARVEVQVIDPRQIQVVVADHGAGFDPTSLKQPHAKRGHGLFGVEERLKLLGGRLDIQSEPGHGTRVTMYIPTKRSQSDPRRS